MRTPEASLAFLREGYPFAQHWRARAPVRTLGRRTHIVSGPDGVALFYDEQRLRRRGALPRPLLLTLFGRGAIHALDDAEHKQRKSLFTTLLTQLAADDIAARAAAGWRRTLAAWRPGDVCSLFDAAAVIHCAAVCEWAGIPADRVDEALARDLVALVDGFGAVGPRHLRARVARARVDAWARAVIRQARETEPADAGPDGATDNRPPVRTVADFRDLSAHRLPEGVAAVELVNLLRPTVAVAYFVAFTAHAFELRPEWRSRIAAGDADTVRRFAEEVRRYYPFVPALRAVVRRTFVERDVAYRAGDRVMLDVWGTLHDPALWRDPHSFDPDRYVDGVPDAHIPQGGADPVTGHRCPGENVALALIEVAARTIASSNLRAVAQDLSIPLDRMPTKPRDGMRMVRTG